MPLIASRLAPEPWIVVVPAVPLSSSGPPVRVIVCGVCVVELASGQVIALLRFKTAVQEIFAVAVLPGRRWPELIHDDESLLENSFVVPDAALADVPAALRAPADPAPRAVGQGGEQAEPRERS